MARQQIHLGDMVRVINWNGNVGSSDGGWSWTEEFGPSQGDCWNVIGISSAAIQEAKYGDKGCFANITLERSDYQIQMIVPACHIRQWIVPSISRSLNKEWLDFDAGYLDE